MSDPTHSPKRSISFDDPSCPSPLFDPSAAPLPDGGAGTALPPTPFHADEPQDVSPGPCAHHVEPPALPDLTPVGSAPADPGAPKPKAPPIEYPRRSSKVTWVEPRKPSLGERIWLPNPIALVLVTVALAAGWAAINWNRALEPTEAHRSLVLTADRVASFLRDETWVDGFPEGFAVQPGAEQLEVRRRLRGDVTLEYRYAASAQPRIVVSTRIDRSIDGARDTFRMLELAQNAHWRDAGGGAAVFLEVDDECSWGDESRANLVEVGGRPIGIGFLARNGRTCIRVVLENLDLDGGTELRSLLDPVLGALAASR